MNKTHALRLGFSQRTRSMFWVSASAFVFFYFVTPEKPARAQIKQSHPEIVAARKARDRASVEELQEIVAETKKEAKDVDGFLRLALFHSWLCEAIETSGKDKLFKQAAEEGVAAAEKAVELNPNSAEAHQLLGDLLNQLIPHVFGGGMRYGKRATDEMDKAIELDPNNVNAYVSRAIGYYYTPDAFGGSKAKAFEMLKKAGEINPPEDAPHIWLAMFYLDTHRKKEALEEIQRARKINPERAFTNYVYKRVQGGGTSSKASANNSANKKSPAKKHE